jgi:hypothetical protein
MTMTEMLEATIARRAELQAEEPKYEITHCGKTFEIEGVGKIWCGIQIAQGATTWMRPHFRRNWKLNGKLIAAAKLAKIIGA